jgi:tetratricopeptide (TPR) repeat protein
MRTCKECGTPLKDEALYCFVCGAPRAGRRDDPDDEERHKVYQRQQQRLETRRRHTAAKAVLILGALAAVGIFAYSRYSPALRTLRLVRQADISGAQTFYRDRVVGKKLEESLLRFRSGPAAGGVLDDYNEDRITYEQAEGEMKLLQQLEFPANGVAPHLKDLAGLKDSKAAYALAVDADQKGDYAQAMAGYANVSSIDRHYKEAEEKAESMAKQYKEDILAQAGNPQNEQDYARAIKILTAAQKILPKDQDFSDTLVTLKQGYSAAVKQQVVAVAKDYISKGYYKQVIDMVGKALTYSSNDLELQTLLTTATNNYEDFAKDQVEIYLGNRDYAGAMALLERVKRDLPDDAVIGQLYETTKSQADLYR